VRRRHLSAVLVAALASAAVRPARADEPPKPSAAASPLTDADRAFFAWWDAHGFPDVGKLPFVKVWTGDWEGRGNDPPVPFVEAGFLLHEDATTFTAFLTNLQTVTLKPTPGRDGPHERIGFDRADLAAYARDGLAVLAKEGPEIPWFRKSDPFGAHRWAIPNQAFRIAVLGRALAARGFDDLARSLCDRALHEATRPSRTEQYGDDDPSPRAMYSSIEEAIEGESAEVLEAKFGDPTLSWTDLLHAHEAWARAFAPQQLDAPDGRVALLRRMVDAEQGRAKDARKPFEKQSPEEKIASLVHDLQDESFETYSSWGLSFREEEDSKTPHARLAALGYAAVPALIDAIDDDRLTRASEWYETGKGQYRNSRSVLRVGELAWRILDHIAGGALRDSGAGGPPTSGRPTRRRAAEAWFETIKTRGEKAVLAEQVEKGDRAARAAADRLVEIDRELAVKALEKGILAGDERGGRQNLVYVLASLESPSAIAAMLRLLPTLGSDRSGITTASALWRRGRREGLDALVRWWRAQATDDGTSRGMRFVMGGFGLDDLVSALAATGHVDAVKALGERIEARSASDRVAIVTAFQPHEGSFRQPYEQPTSREAEAAIETLLAERLADPEHATGLHMGSGDIGKEPVVGEIAAWVLSRRYPARWKFDPNAAAEVRQSARVALSNAWRAKHGQPALAPEPGARVDPVAPEKAKPLVAAWLGAADDDAREAAETAIVEAGLGMLPALRVARDALKPGAPQQRSLDRLLQRVAMIVREVRWSEKGPRPNESLSGYADGAKGQPMTGEWLTELWRVVALDAPEGATGVDFRMTRPSDGTGVAILLELTTDTTPWGGGDGGWILAGDGMELVDDDFLKDGKSWWHKARGPQIDARLQVAETQDFRMRWTIKKGKG
jgi:hypothetical protein